MSSKPNTSNTNINRPLTNILLTEVGITFACMVSGLSLSERTGVLGPEWKSACFVCQPPVPFLQDEGCCFGLPLPCKDAFLVPHNTRDSCRYKRKYESTEEDKTQHHQMVKAYNYSGLF